MSGLYPVREGERPTVLLVDDEADILVALEDLLDGEFRLLTTTSPARALEMLAVEAEVAVIVSDQRMPEMPGNQFLARARALCEAETLLLTGYADLDAVISAVNDGRIAGYAHKPWEPRALRGMIAAAAERFRLRRALAFEQAAFKALVAASPDRIALMDADGAYLRGDPALARDDERGDDRQAVRDHRAGEEERQEGAGLATLHRRIRRIPFAVGDTAYLLKIEADESERRRLEARLHQSEKLQALGTLAGGIAHDFNNLLTVVTGNLELAGDRAEEPRLQRYVRNAAEAARRGASLTKRLLSFSRQPEAAARTAEPNALVRGMEELILRTTGGLVTLDYGLAEDVWPVRIDPEQLELALLNLAINAADAMPGGGPIRIATANRRVAPGEDAMLVPGDYVAIALADRGEGMADEVVARVFEPFFTTKPRSRGTGLGLPMVHAMASNAGGRVEIATRPGEGTTVTVLLPRDAAAPDDPPVPAATAAPCAERLHVLLVEDDADVRAVSEAYLDQLGHRVEAIGSAQEAIERVDGGARVDLLMTDFAMPGLSGAQLAEEMERRRPELPVLLVTGYAEVGRLPARVSTLRKPFSRAELAVALAAACRA